MSAERAIATRWRCPVAVFLLLLAGCYPDFNRSDYLEATTDRCSDGVDNDEDGLTDCDDPRCATVVVCFPDAMPPDGPPGPDAAPDAGPDACTPEPTPEFCRRLGSECGPTTGTDFYCGSERITDCGLCAWPDTCAGGGADNICGCTPTTCFDEQKNCDDIDDQCGGTIFCGECTPPDTCGGIGIPNSCGCTPTSCAAQGKNCDTISDGCYGTIFCGVCSGGETCGGGGEDNVCG